MNAILLNILGQFIASFYAICGLAMLAGIIIAITARYSETMHVILSRIDRAWDEHTKRKGN